MALIAGIDEVGRGPWAGPLVVGIVVFDDNTSINGLNDSKKLSKKRREDLNICIKQQAKAIGIGWVDARDIDQLGLSKSLKLATKRAFMQIPSNLDSEIERIIIDGTIKLLDDKRVVTLIKADGKIPAVSAASIVAKVARDHYMTELDKLFPDYNFPSHVGYGTATHRQSLEKHGVISGVHRESFAPIAQFAGKIAPTKPDRVSMTSGRIAEQTAAKYLQALGHTIIATNWKTKLCEIDIISEINHELHFTEVKYRKNDSHGDGMAAITTLKQRQMRFSAEVFMSNHKDNRYSEFRLSAISLSGEPPIVDGYLESI